MNIIELNKLEIDFINGGCNHYNPNCASCQFDGAIALLVIVGYAVYYTALGVYNYVLLPIGGVAGAVASAAIATYKYRSHSG